MHTRVCWQSCSTSSTLQPPESSAAVLTQTNASSRRRRQRLQAIFASSSEPGHSYSCHLNTSSLLQERNWARRHVIFGTGLLSVGLSVVPAIQAGADETIPAGYRQYVDKLDGYSFNLPKDWTAVTSSGNDVFFRNPFNVSENVFVGLSSPSSRKYDSLNVLGDPDKAAQQTLKQFLDELGTTRLGVKREGEVVTASRRTGPDGHEYYDVQLRVKSYASRNQLAVYQKKVDSGLQLEWDRRYLTTLGVANNQLYQLRLQTSTKQYDKSEGVLLDIARSFQCREVEK